MSQLQYFTYPGFAENLSESSWYSQAVRIDDRIEISGQGGWDPTTGAIPTDFPSEVAQAFRNVDLALHTAGGKGFSQVYRINMYLTTLLEDEEVFAVVRRNMADWMPEHRPLLTAVGVKALGVPGMRIEVEIVAVGVE
ncbi:hypothetical protein MBLNU230_g4484t1 [Neophaeotheca triangularis]